MNHFTSRLIRRSPLAAVAAAGAVSMVCLSWSGSAAATNTLGVDLSFNNSVNEDNGAGAGVDIYFGPRMDLGLVALTTELDAGFHDFGGGVLEPTVYRAMAGGRLSLGAIVRPSVFAHIGAGHLRWDDFPGSGTRDSRTNLATDLGAALDFTVLPLVDLGVHVSYNTIGAGSGDPAFNWWQAGAHMVFVFGS